MDANQINERVTSILSEFDQTDGTTEPDSPEVLAERALDRIETLRVQLQLARMKQQELAGEVVTCRAIVASLQAEFGGVSQRSHG